jgi:hypothetical protein
VYEVKPKYSPKLAREAKKYLDPKYVEQTEQEVNKLAPLFGGPPGAFPDGFKEAVAFAEEMKKKCGIN